MTYRRATTLLALLLAVLPVFVDAGNKTHLCADADKGNPSLGISRYQFTSGINQREPVDRLTELSGGINPVYFFTEASDGAGEKIIHRWYHNDVLQAEVSLNLGGDRWRTRSLKHMGFLTFGTWKIEVVDSNYCLLLSQSISFPPSSATAKKAKAISQPTDKRVASITEKASQLLQEGKFLDAELLLKKELSAYDKKDPAYASLSGQLSIDLPLARASSRLENDDLYLLAEDLQTIRGYVQGAPGEAAYTRRLQTMQAELDGMLEDYDRNTETTLAATGKSIASRYAITGTAPASAEEVQALLGNEDILVNEVQFDGSTIHIIATDKRTGKVYELDETLAN